VFDLGAHEKDRALLEAKVMASVQKWSGERLDRAMDKAMRITHGEDAGLLRIGREMARAVAGARGGVHGADDTQLPAVSKLPPLVAVAGAADDLVDRAVRVTNDSDAAVAAVAAAGEKRARLEEALAFEGDAAARFGRACPLAQAVPVWLNLLRDAADFATALRANILAGGDSAGRGVILGAVLGASLGVPEEWAARTHARAEVDALLERATGGG
jgi:ADP-ribosylglycohydrolase